LLINYSHYKETTNVSDITNNYSLVRELLKNKFRTMYNVHLCII